MVSPVFPCYNILISIPYVLHIVNAFGDFIGTVKVYDLEYVTYVVEVEFVSGYRLQDTGYRIQDTGYRI